MSKEDAKKAYQKAIQAIRKDPKSYTPEQMNVLREAALGGMTKEQLKYVNK